MTAAKPSSRQVLTWSIIMACVIVSACATKQAANDPFGPDYGKMKPIPNPPEPSPARAATRATPAPRPPSSAGAAPARPAQTAQAAVPRPVPAPAATAANPARAAQLRAQGLEQLNRGEVASAISSLQQAQRLDPNNALIKRDLDRAVRIRSAVQAQ